MGPTYYQIELTARMLTVLLVVLALLLVLAFAFGYGAAWSVLTAASRGGQIAAVATATPAVTTPAVTTPVATTPVATAPVATAPAPRATAVPTRPTVVAAPPATATPRPRPTATRPVPPTRVATAVPATGTFWVQVLAVGRHDAVEQAQAKIEHLGGGGFPRSNQQVVRSPVAGGGVLYKLRIGPFPDHDSAARVALRMQRSGFPDAWVLQQ